MSLSAHKAMRTDSAGKENPGFPGEMILGIKLSDYTFMADNLLILYNGIT